MPIGVIEFDFHPVLALAGTLTVRWQTLALAAVIAFTLVVAGLEARRASLRADDLLFIVVGIVPGAVIGGRLGYAILHWGSFGGDPGALLDPSRSGLELAGAVIGGALSGAYVASLLGGSVVRWAAVLALPLLFVLGAGKLTMVLGGAGQGMPSDASWATAYLGPGPWGSLAPELPSVPAQAVEGIATIVWRLLLAVALWIGLIARHDGRLLLIAIGGWALVRAVVSTTWRDPTVIGPLPAGGLIALVLAGICLAGIVAWSVAAARSASPTAASPTAAPATAASPPAPVGDASGETPNDPAWPDPATRPRF